MENIIKTHQTTNVKIKLFSLENDTTTKSRHHMSQYFDTEKAINYMM